MSFPVRSVLAAAFLILGLSELRAADAETDWQAVIALDSGPTGEPMRTPEAAGQRVLDHLDRQEAALRNFLAAHPKDAHAFEGQLRLARLLQIRADFEGSEKARQESKRLLDQLEKIATPEQRPELDFAKVARLMRSLRQTGGAQRDEVYKAARAFQAAYPSDRRIAALLTEIATLFDDTPKTKEALLEDAQAVATDPELKGRLADDLKRVRMVGEEVPLQFTSVQGEEIKARDPQGRPTFVIFFADFSPASTQALTKLQQSVAQMPKGSVRVIGICLDDKREVLTALLKTRNITWPVAFDGLNWQSPLVRSLGINALPTVWLLDGQGRLRSLNALNGAVEKVRLLQHDQ